MREREQGQSPSIFVSQVSDSLEYLASEDGISLSLEHLRTLGTNIYQEG